MTKTGDTMWDSMDLHEDYVEYKYTIVITESGDCKCGKVHERGDAVAGFASDPITNGLIENVDNIHSKPFKVEYDA